MNNEDNTNKTEWKGFAVKLANESGLAVAVFDENGAVGEVANNNSICEQLYGSKNFSKYCAEFCGEAFEAAHNENRTCSFRCYAGLECAATPLKQGEKKLVAITGRTFVSAQSYREATQRAITGDWREFPPTQFFGNVLLTGALSNLEKLSSRIEKLTDAERDALFASTMVAPVVQKQPAEEVEKAETESQTLEEIVERVHETQQIRQETEAKSPAPTIDEVAAWRSTFGSLLTMDYEQACVSVLEFVSKRWGLQSMSWMQNADGSLRTVLSIGGLKNQQIKLAISADDARLLDAAKRETSLELRERSKRAGGEATRINLFPVAVGNEVRSALVVGDDFENNKMKRQIARFCHSVAPELEILRLREELSRRGIIQNALRKFNESLRSIDSVDFWLELTRLSAELIRAERASLLIFDEAEKKFDVAASIGSSVDFSKKEKIGERVAKMVLKTGKAMLVGDVRKVGIETAPVEWRYKTESFICYPITIGDRRIAVLNFTDKADGGIFNEFDVELLQAISPQIAVAIDRTSLKSIAGELHQLSVTDPLTGLLNRRYLEERLAEEIKRSNRHGFPMTFMMIDVDEFKSYNDAFGHPEGDKALKLVGIALKDTLRGADVAARFGGEEFSILLPQTTQEEAIVIAERVRKRVEVTDFPNRDVTVSIGIAGCSFDLDSAELLIAAADKALYEAKRQGRNNVQVYGSTRKKAQNGAEHQLKK